MLRHVVLIKLNEGVTAQDPRARAMAAAFEPLGESIPELRFWQTGWNVSPRDVAYDFVLIADVEDEDALARYTAHPEHQAAVTLLRRVASLVVVDFWV